MTINTQPTAIMIVIGNEVLSGRTQDKNIGWVAEKLTENGIKLLEARIISDDEDVIASAVRDLSEKVDYVFTSGGIGPTHDDITTKSIAKAFDVPVIQNQEALRRLKEHYKGTGIELNSARLKMADIPKGAKLVDNPVSAAPGYNINNVFVNDLLPLKDGWYGIVTENSVPYGIYGGIGINFDTFFKLEGSVLIEFHDKYPQSDYIDNISEYGKNSKSYMVEEPWDYNSYTK